MGGPPPRVRAIVRIEAAVRSHTPRFPEMRGWRRFHDVRVSLFVRRPITVLDRLGAANFLNDVAIPAVGLPFDAPVKLAARQILFLSDRIGFDEQAIVVRRRGWG